MAMMAMMATMAMRNDDDEASREGDDERTKTHFFPIRRVFTHPQSNQEGSYLLGICS